MGVAPGVGLGEGWATGVAGRTGEGVGAVSVVWSTVTVHPPSTSATNPVQVRQVLVRIIGVLQPHTIFDLYYSINP